MNSNVGQAQRHKARVSPLKYSHMDRVLAKKGEGNGRCPITVQPGCTGSDRSCKRQTEYSGLLGSCKQIAKPHHVEAEALSLDFKPR